jgi:hypothetical protein
LKEFEHVHLGRRPAVELAVVVDERQELALPLRERARLAISFHVA